MNFTETSGYLRWLAQADNRILVSEPNVEIWQNSLSGLPMETVKAVTLEHYRTNENVMPTPAMIRKTGYAAIAREHAKQSALEASKPVRTPDSYRQRNPELWDELFEKGRRERANDLRSRGLIA